MDKDYIATLYNNAKILVKLNRPKEARNYVLGILNYSLEYYKSLSSIEEKEKTKEFMRKWINVSKELYDTGITDYVLKCFSLNDTENEDNNIIERSDSQGWCAELFEKYKRSIVKIKAYDEKMNSSGTGFIINNEGYVLTNNHIIYNRTNSSYYSGINMCFENDDKTYKLNLLFCDAENDIALCKFDINKCKDYSIIPIIKDYNSLKQGADCLVIGNPFNLGLAPFTGIIKYKEDRNGDLIYQAPSNLGDSGGPVLNRNGECIGINKSKMTKYNNMNVDGFALATTAKTIKTKLNKWIENNKKL